MINQCFLVGRLTRDPELRTTSTGLDTCRVSIAVNDMPNQNGETHTNFINVVAWRNTATNLCKYCKKGSQIAVVGKINQNTYEASDGTTKTSFDVVANQIMFLEHKQESSEATQETTQVEEDNTFTKSFNSDEIVLSDDDLPF